MTDERKWPGDMFGDDADYPSEPTLTASEVKVLTETAGEAGRRIGWKAAGEEIAAELVKAGEERSKDRHHKVQELRDHGSTRYAAYLDAATIAHNIASQPPGASPDATSGVPEHPEVSEAVRSPQEPRCPSCGSERWVSVSLNEGLTRLAQCVPCGAYHKEVIGPGWRSPRFHDPEAVHPDYREDRP